MLACCAVEVGIALWVEFPEFLKGPGLRILSYVQGQDEIRIMLESIDC